MREQHAHVLTVMQLPNVKVQVLPFAAGRLLRPDEWHDHS
ncbi:Scr1 family TA system antitoxin-like transcriptional regulator [Kitasatospora sp. GP30]|nr:Scr1 family TA system antitoxin-like transcriptional regulator [Kitasatospora sp. GP30]